MSEPAQPDIPVMQLLRPEGCCLIAVDLQNAFCSRDGWHRRRGMNIDLCEAAVQGCQRLVEGAHCAGVPVVYTRYVYQPGHQDGGVLTEYLMPELKESGALLPDSWDAQIYDVFAPADSDLVIDKSRYSAFYGTRLEPLLRALRTQTLVVCGVTTSMCVESTVRDGFERDYLVFVPSDATGEFTGERQRRGLTSVAEGFGWVVTVQDVLDRWAVPGDSPR